MMRHGKYIFGKWIYYAVVFLVIQLLLMPSVSFAGILVDSGVSCLSPGVTADISSFYQSFQKAYEADTDDGVSLFKSSRQAARLSVGVPKEILSGEGRVGLTEKGVKFLAQNGVAVYVESGAGQAGPIGGTQISDEDYRQAGAIIVKDAKELWEKANLIVKVKEPQKANEKTEFEEVNLIKPQHVIFTYFHLAPDKELTDILLKKKATCIAYETVVVDGQTPLLAPMSKVAGVEAAYAAAIFESFARIEKRPDGQSWEVANISEIKKRILETNKEHVEKTLLGEKQVEPIAGISPKKLVVFGGGAVGLNAALAYLRLGAEKVTITETMPGRRAYLRQFFREQGFEDKVVVINDARFIKDNRKTFDDFSDAQKLEAMLKEADCIISGVYAPGKKAPLLLSETDLSRIGSGKILIDVSIDQGGNFALSKKTFHDQPVFVDRFGNIRYCVANIPAAVPRAASYMLEEAKIDYVLALAQMADKAVLLYPELSSGFSIREGKLLDQSVADAQGQKGKRVSRFDFKILPFDYRIPEKMKQPVMRLLRKKLAVAVTAGDIKGISIKLESSSEQSLRGFKGSSKIYGQVTKDALIDRICAMTYYTRNELKYDKKYTSNVLWAMYYDLLAKREFRDLVEKGRWTKLAVEIKLSDGSVIDRKILVENKDAKFAAYLLNEDFETAEKIFTDLVKNVQTIFDSNLRKGIHVFERQKRELEKMNEYIGLLNSAVVDLAEHLRSLSEADLKKALKKIEIVRGGLANSKRAKKNAHIKLSRVLDPQKGLESGYYADGAAILIQTIKILETRKNFLIKRLNERPDEILSLSGRPKDYMALMEKKARQAKQQAADGNPQAVLNILRDLSLLLSQREKTGIDVEETIDLGNMAEQVSALSREAVEGKEKRQMLADALRLIAEVDARVKKHSQKLSEIAGRPYLTGLKQAIYKLDNIQRGKVYREVLLEVLEIIAVADLNNSPLALIGDEDFMRLNALKSEINATIGLAQKCNEAIKKVLPLEKLETIKKTKETLALEEILARGTNKGLLEGMEERLELFRLRLTCLQVSADVPMKSGKVQDKERRLVPVQRQLLLFVEEPLILQAI